MTENNNLQELNNIREYYQTLYNLQYEQLIILHKENYQLRLKINQNKQRKLIKIKEYEDKLEKLQILANDASIRLNEGSELIRKLQKHLKISQEKLSDKTKELLTKNETLHKYQSHIIHLNDRIKQLIDEYTTKNLQVSFNLNDNQKIDVAIQTSPTLSIQRRCVRFNLDKENYSIDSKYFQSK
ncbi:unnamed protein product [Rotaria sp. Silwood1]|nr:unnamed protein product [Rotaria sp. Silwood1]CAF3593226.1 unnamed protein product [Rotaria sp. Silwood1]CAF4541996.1 unnamed protein product [Rotaria sp. Silwood1]